MKILWVPVGIIFFFNISCDRNEILEKNFSEIKLSSEQLKNEEINEVKLNEWGQVFGLETELNKKPESLLFDLFEMGTKPKDNTRKFLTVLEKSNCNWEICAYLSDGIVTDYTFLLRILEKKFRFEKTKKSNQKSFFLKEIDLNPDLVAEKMFLSSEKGKKNHSYHPLVYKHLGRRNGCFLLLNFDGVPHRFELTRMFSNEEKTVVYAKFQELKTNIFFYLKSTDVDLSKPNLTPYYLLKTTKGLSQKNKNLYYALTFIGTPVLIGLGVITVAALIIIFV